MAFLRLLENESLSKQSSFYSRSRKRQVENAQGQKDVIQVNVSARRKRKLKQVGDDRCEINSPLRDQYPWWSGLRVHLALEFLMDINKKGTPTKQAAKCDRKIKVRIN